MGQIVKKIKKPRSKERKQKEIFKAALKLFAHYGFKKTTIEDVASEVGMTKSNIYFYAATKKDLYEKTVGSELQRWRDSIAVSVNGVDDVVEKFKLMAIGSFTYLSNHGDLRSILINDPSIFTLSQKEDRFYEINHGAMQIIKEILAQGVNEGRFKPVDIERTSELLFSIYIMFLIKTYVKSEGSSASRLYEEGVELILHGLCKN
jgi:AcrR family transcriptional regulator